jgi:Fe-S-cluster-containing dehydrogenase component
MKRIYVFEDLCNGCRLCQTFCSSLEAGVFGEHGRVRVLKVPGEERDIPIVDCDGVCLRPIYDDHTPTCVSVCPTGALIFADQEEAIDKRLAWEKARQTHGLFKLVAPWKWPFEWNEQAANTEIVSEQDRP